MTKWIADGQLVRKHHQRIKKIPSNDDVEDEEAVALDDEDSGAAVVVEQETDISDIVDSSCDDSDMDSDVIYVHISDVKEMVYSGPLCQTFAMHFRRFKHQKDDGYT